MIAPLADADARQLAVSRFDVPVLLEAGAGTGKTRALVSRLLAWSLGPGWVEAAERRTLRAREVGARPPDDDQIAADVLDGLVAITFTEAAAAEMASRFGEALTAVATGRSSGDAADIPVVDGTDLSGRARCLLDALGRVRIQTIHAFCRALLAEHPFEARLHPAFGVDAQEQALERLADEVLADQLSARLAGEGDGALLALLAAGVRPEEIRSSLLLLAREGATAATLEDDPLSPETAAALLRETEETLRTFTADLLSFASQLPARQRAPAELASRLSDLLPELASSDPPLARLERAVAEVAEVLELWEKSALRKWAQGDSISTIEKYRPAGAAPFATVAASALQALLRLRGLSPARLTAVRTVLAPLLRALRERMRRAGAVLYSDLLAEAADLLTRHRSVRESVRRGIRQLLIDEFQDTDRQQCRLIEQLALVPGAATPGLFVVGDPKQSIYAWRRADLAAYEQFLARAVDAGAVQARLAVNFRSVPAILAEVQCAVDPVMEAEAGIQPAFEPLVAARETAESSGPAVEYWSSKAGEPGEKATAAAATRVEAAALARDLLARRAAEPTRPWGSFGVLLRTSTDQEIYLQALREAGVPFEVERDRSYWQRREVIDLNAAVRAILLPGDHLAMLAFLRSPFVGVPDAALVPLWRHRLPERFDALGDDAGEDDALATILTEVEAEIAGAVPGLDRIAGWSASARLACQAVAELRRSFGSEPADDWVERLRSRLAPEATAAGRFLGRFGVANLGRYLRDLAVALEAGGGNPGAVVRALHRDVLERRAAEEARPAAGDADAVRVMTIHRAKGLEFGQLYLMQLHKTARSDSPDTDGFEPARDGQPAVYQLLKARTPGWEAERERRARSAAAERVRLLYVGLTRARDRLVIAGDFESRRQDGSLAALLGERIAQLVPAGTFPASPTVDGDSVLLRALGRETAETGEPSVAAESAPPIADPTALRADLDRLTERRRTAQARADRPLLAPMSAAVSQAAGTLAAQAASQVAGTLPSQVAGTAASQVAGTFEGGWDGRERGRALHRAFELAALASVDPGRWRRAVLAAAEGALEAAAAAQLDRELERLLASSLWQRQLDLDPVVLGRELPVLLAAAPDADGLTRPEAPLSGWVGTIDLLYRDPDTRELVVADFKSDQLDDEAAAAAAAQRYAPQLRLYGAAIAAAWPDEPRPPRLELWLLALDRVVVLSASETPAARIDPPPHPPVA